MEYTGGNDNDIEARVKTPLEGNGDFRNQECYNQLHSPTPGDFYTNMVNYHEAKASWLHKKFTN